MKNYSWQRYWYKAGETPRIFNGFLSVWDEFENVAFHFEKFSQIPCLVLLGEPGMGKSKEIEKIYENQTEDDNTIKFYRNLASVPDSTYLNNKVFNSTKIKTWKDSNINLYLFLDSLDEALLNINTLSGLLTDEIGELPTNRLFLRVTCRSAQWSSLSKFENKLRNIWKKEDFQIINLAPLRREDVKETAKIEEQNGEKFIEEIFEKNVSPLAAKPITLKLLLNIFKERSELPSNQVELYKRGCLTLCDEDYEDKPVSKKNDKLTAEQRLRVAARIAALMIFSNKSSIWIGRDTGEQTNADISSSELLGYFEKGLDNVEFHIGKEEVEETIHKGLFSNDGANRIKFSHQTFAEFLAAWYLDYREVSDETIIKIIGEKYLQPQLYETSAWIVNQRKEISNHLMRVAPMVLLRSDVLSMEDSFRDELTKVLLENFDSEKSFETDEYGYFRRLKHTKIAEQLRPYIKDKTKGWVVRKAAINIASECAVKELQNDLADIALDKEDDHYIRVSAAIALKSIADNKTLRRLEPLIFEGSNTDENLELKFLGIEALWRENLTAEKLFEVLEEPRGYSYFFNHQLTEKLEPEDLPVALDWLERKVKQSHLSYDIESIADQILFKAWHNLDQQAILSKFARIVFIYAKTHQHIFNRNIDNNERLKISQDTEKRRKVLLELLTLIKKEDDWWHLGYSNIFSFKRTDTNWMVEEILNSSNLSIKLKLIYILKGWVASDLSYYLEGADPDFWKEVCRGINLNQDFKDEFYEYYKAIELASNEAELWKTGYANYIAAKNRLKVEEKEEDLLSPSPKERVLEWLDKFDNGELDAFWQVNYFMMFLPNGHSNINEGQLDLTKFPVWKEIDEETKKRVIQTAKEYLLQGDPMTEKWIKKAEPYRPATAGYRAINLLNQFEPTVIENLTKEVWLKWISAIYFTWVTSPQERIQQQKQFISNVHKFAPEAIAELLSTEISRENKKENPYLRLDKLDLCWDENLRNVLKENLIKSSLPQLLFNEILYKLFELSDRDAEKITCSFVKYPVPKREKAQKRLVTSVGVLIQYGKTQCWQKIWDILNKDVLYGRNLVESFVSGVSRNRTGVLNLSEKQAADLFLWLSENYPQSEDPVHYGTYSPSARDGIVSWRNSFLYYLIEKGTVESVSQFTRIKNELPHLEQLKSMLLTAEEKMREKSWLPFSAQELLKTVNAQKRKDNMADLTKLPTKIKVLFLAANPQDQSQLALDEEIRVIQQKIRASDYRDSVDLRSRWAVRSTDLLQALNEEKPNIVHFSGHGTDTDEIVFVDSNGNSKFVTKDAIVQLMNTTSDNIQVVIFNTCFSSGQAQAITEYIDVAIGMGNSISDETARIFAAQFYSAIGFGYSVSKAFAQAKTAIMLESLLEEDIPQIFTKQGIDPNDLILVRPE